MAGIWNLYIEKSMNIAKLLKYLLIDQFTFYGGGGKGGGGGDAPDPPDPYKVAGATTQTNKETAAYNKDLNLNNYSNPFGSQQSQIVGYGPSGAPIYNTTISANPQLQNALSSLLSQTGQSGQLNSAAIGNLSNLAGQYGDLNTRLSALGGTLDMDRVKAAQQQGQDAAYAAQTQYLDPQFSQQGESLDAKLANQGLTPGSEAYNNAMLNFGNQKQQAYSNAQNQAILTGSQIGAQNLQNQLQGLGAQASLIGQQGGNLGALASIYGQQAQIGQLPYSNLATIASLIPGYAGPAQSASSPANIGSNIYSNYQAQLNNYNAAQQSANSFTGGLFGLGSAGILASQFSDRRAKRDIRRIGRLRNGLPWYSFRYVWDSVSAPVRQGVMADEVRLVAPHAIAKHVSGLDMVDYAQVM
jgi:hypothetical protein